MRRTNTTFKPFISVERPNGPVEVFPTAEPNHRTKIVISGKSELRAEPHGHEQYDEYIRVSKGRIRVTIGDVTRECSSEDGDLEIPKFTIHEIMRADIDMKSDLEETGDVEVWEWTDPARR